ncbi:MAG: hypothetical protein DKM50_03175 [Candidatus Margulisiibacteriota bacterium]|nr:MAG: hypothetical protein A2X43_09720 [Candidatus Margulisbacteria bacterium GWD2_39_127]OGI04598.1 MAG: hypothetical protein A2X42_07810 [Candidatus Margulisbacteria bacterium GWF2_38_17]OGI11870.1 MAG: hypothetical protein A2X41_11460 [Candidatus Margulisbacteria bacterium GWE2_39_32]PZM83119.1 MAG: hypothetical protein DKM50_03175 [Candidatus Margulisiibacteriota bacterium]HAR62213.1 hypothetical protein [Candidatus Margulisiibacteriota bacterium]
MSKILIVDDSPFIRMKCRKILEEENFELFEADNGETAIQLVEEVCPDVVLLDVVMPKLDGFSACRQIKERHPEIPVIIVTTMASKDDIVKGLTYGSDDYIVKPFKEPELKARIAAMLRIKTLYDKVKEKNKELELTNLELKNTKDKLRQQEKVALIGQLMVGIHHEIRNPLTAVLANSQILLRHFELPEEGRGFLGDIEDQAKKIRDILDQIKEMDLVEVIDYVDGTKMIQIKKNSKPENFDIF